MNLSFTRSQPFCTFLLAALAALGAGLATPATAKAQNPSAADVINKYIEATGGQEALKKVKSIEVRGKLDFFNRQIGVVTADLSVYQTNDAFLLTIAMPGAGDVVQGRNGDVAWAARANGTIAKLEGKEKQQMIQNARMHAQLQWIDYDGEITVQGEADVDGKAAWHLSFKPNNGVPADRYFDKETGLLLKVSMLSVTEIGELPTDSYLSEYREFEGVKLACQMKQVLSVGGVDTEMVYKYEDVKVNEDIPAERFAPPAGIED